MWGDYFDEELLKKAADLIHRLQSENAEQKRYIKYLQRKLKQANVTYRSNL